MFITIRFGDDEQLLFNPDCSPKILLDNIKRRCHVSQRVEIDLMDEDGELKQLSQLLQHDQQQSCGTFFADRAIYYLIKLDRTESRVKYVSLLNNMIELHPLLAAKLEELSYPRSSEAARPMSRDRWSKAMKKANKTTSTSKSKKQPRERDSSKASSRLK